MCLIVQSYTERNGAVVNNQISNLKRKYSLLVNLMYYANIDTTINATIMDFDFYCNTHNNKNHSCRSTVFTSAAHL